METIRERPAWKMNGFVALVFILALLGLELFLFITMISEKNALLIPVVILLGITLIILLSGLMVVPPNGARVLVFFGSYIGSVRDSGFWWVNPFTTKRHISLRINNFNSERIKVNDLSGNPIEIAAVVVWRVVDTSKAVFDVENYTQFVNIQSETAIRTLASRHPYDVHDEDRVSLRGSPDEISENLRTHVQARLDIAGLEVSEARISHLAYAPEIAQVMLRRQQAEAIIAARQRIVEGAVGMVEMALRMLSEQNVVQLDEERKAAMINNMLVALVSESQATPILNAGTLYT